MMYHLGITIDDEITRIKEEGRTLLSDENGKANLPEILSFLEERKAAGKIYHSGCDRMDFEGKCAGHATNDSNQS